MTEEGLAWLPEGVKGALVEAVRDVAAGSLVCELGTQGVSRMPLEVRSRFGCAHRCEAFSV
ncbi:hypothetical protein [Sorangium sp. So ce131]|uniref:hypothetical protein n=1 Tax=Sorangium sp. So ce131 TaxID=3133282 RepID=UPI003F5F60F9